MNAIFFKDNVYIAVLDKDTEDFDTIQENPTFIGSYNCDEIDKYLYGGRVNLYFTSDTIAYLCIDGISIKRLERNGISYNFDNRLSLETCVAFLNQIENLGVDSFLSNYRQSLDNFKQEIERQASQLSQEISLKENEKKESLLTQIELLLHEIVCMMFLLSINMNAGLDNHVYIETSEKIINQFFNE